MLSTSIGGPRERWKGGVTHYSITQYENNIVCIELPNVYTFAHS